jgi:hypothetical protein
VRQSRCSRPKPICSSDGKSDSYLPIDSVVGEGVFERIQNEFRDDQAEAYGLTRGHSTRIAGHFQRRRAVIAFHCLRVRLFL